MILLGTTILVLTLVTLSIMAASLGLLKNLPCPAGQNCTAFQCLFKHPDDDTDGKTNSTTIGSSLPQSNTQETPRKRIKLSKNPSDAQQDHLMISESDQAILAVKDEKSKPPMPLGAKVSGLSTKPITPPPIVRKGNSPGKGTDNLGSVPPSHRAAIVASTQKPQSMVPVQTQAKSVQTKPETLNPRHLKKAPAKHDMRYELVKLLHANYQRLNNELKNKALGDESSLIMSQQQLITKTLDDEEEIAVNKPATYANTLKNKVFSYKKMSVDQWETERVDAVKKAEGGSSLSQEPDNAIQTGLNPAQEVEFLQRIASPLKGLEQFGYISAVPKAEDVEKARKAVEASGNVEVCDRCATRFTVFPGRREEDGALASGGKCVHHPGKTYFVLGLYGERSSSPKKWRCCDQTVGETPGCVTGMHHVFKTTDPNRCGSILQFAETPPNSNVPKDRAVCFDCEMGYTVYGMELIRLTAVSWPSGDELLDVLVYPFGEYIDLNTRYSGVSPEDMASAKRWKVGDDATPTILPSSDPSKPPLRKLKIVPSPKAARDLFFSFISPSTPLVGHGLENDLNALRVVHPLIVDSILLYPHKRGLPIRNGLKYLTETMLGRKIQVTSNNEDEVQGHDSAEDARAAGELVRLKVKSEWKNMQMRGWTIADNGSLKAPDDGWTVVGDRKTRHG